MRKHLLILLLSFCALTFAQTKVSGVVKNTKSEALQGANIKVSGESSGTTTDSEGNFNLTTSKKPPFSIEVSSVGFKAQSIQVSSNNKKLSIIMEIAETTLDEVVISASRTPERVRESPVTIERMTIADIKKSASPSFYDGLENLKEVQMNTSSLSFKSINTRGFATVANTRFMQLVDGMDNSSPLLNFVLGNLIGVSELDVQNVELLPGASSALYGANAFNGILFMNSKNPFTSEGITAYAKYGNTSQQAAGVNNFFDIGIRAAKVIRPYFAVKANFTLFKGTDWYATDYQDLSNPGADRSFHNYNGVNVYGDEVSTNIKDVGKTLVQLGRITPAQASVLPNYNVSRTGYNETDLTDNKVANTKVDYSLHFKPFVNNDRDWARDIEVIWQSKYGLGNTVYQGANRYYLNNFFMSQHKIELKGRNFFLRGYTTTENGGESYDMLFTGININRKWKDDSTWFGQYAGAFIQSTLLAGATPTQAHLTARAVADNGRLLPGSADFVKAFNEITSEADVRFGSKLIDQSRIYHSDVNYNLKEEIKFAEVQIGGSYRIYDLNSFGRIYTDKDSPIDYNEYGIYTQIQKRLLEDRLKLTGSMRYDKSKNFDGNVSPRVSAVYSAGSQKEHNFRGSFQTGFRNPTTQDQYIGFNVGTAVLLGSAPDNLSRYSEVRGGDGINGTISSSGIALLTALNGGTVQKTVTIDGNNAYFNSYTLSSVREFAAFAAANPGNSPGAASLLRKTNVDFVKPETVKAFEFGYRGQFKGFNIDLNGYSNVYNNFIGNLTVVAPLYGKASQTFDFASGAPNYLANPEVQSVLAIANNDFRSFQLYTNTDVEIESIGFGVGVSKKIYKDFELGVNYNYADFDFDQAKDPSFEPSFNTPKHRVKASIGNEKLLQNFGFNISGRWNSEYLYQSPFADGMISEATVIDAQINYFIPDLKATIKVGASNLSQKEYRQILGAGAIGTQYFMSLTIVP